MCVRLALLCGLSVLGSALRQTKSENSTSDEWHAVVYDGKLEFTTDAPPAFTHLFKGKIYLSMFGRGRPPLKLPAKSSIATIEVTEVGRALAQRQLGNMKVETRVADGILWPNKLDHAPPSVSGDNGDVLVIPDGFLPPGKQDGNIFLSKDGNVHRITPKMKGAFYHEVQWIDIDGDGHLDILCPRAIVSSEGFSLSLRGEFMWYRNPGPSNIMAQEWEEHKIMDGPDVICHTKAYQDGLASFCSQFWDGPGKLVVHFMTKRAELQWSRVIDADCKRCFSVEPVDLDGDGVLDLLATNHLDKANESAVFGYEVPWDDLQHGQFKKHVFATNIFKTILGNRGVGSPGFAEAFHPRVGQTSGPKHIVVAGDGSLDVWHLAPVPGQRFQYTARQVAPPRGTSGKLLVHDFDGDGIVDVLVPDNDKFELTAFTFSQGPPPSTTQPPRNCPWFCSIPFPCQIDACKFNCDKCIA